MAINWDKYRQPTKPEAPTINWDKYRNPTPATPPSPTELALAEQTHYGLFKPPAAKPPETIISATTGFEKPFVPTPEQKKAAESAAREPMKEAIRAGKQVGFQGAGDVGFLGTFINNFIPLKGIDILTHKDNPELVKAKQEVLTEYSQAHPIKAVIAEGAASLANLVLGAKAGAGLNLSSKIEGVAGTRNLFPTLTRVVGHAIETGSTFGIVGTIKEAFNQIQNNDFQPVKLVKTGLKEAAVGTAVGSAGALPTTATRVATAGSAMGGITAIEALIKNKKLTAEDFLHIGVNTIVGSLFELFGGNGKTELYKGQTYENLQRDIVTGKIQSNNPDLSWQEAEHVAITMNTLGKEAAMQLQESQKTRIVQILEKLPPSFEKYTPEAKNEFVTKVSEEIIKNDIPVEDAINNVARATDSAVNVYQVGDVFKDQSGAIKQVDNTGNVQTIDTKNLTEAQYNKISTLADTVKAQRNQETITGAPAQPIQAGQTVDQILQEKAPVATPEVATTQPTDESLYFKPKIDQAKRFASMDQAKLDEEITNRVDAFRQQSDLMAKKEGAGVRGRAVFNETSGEFKRYVVNFNEDRAKADMARSARQNKKYAEQLLYENDEAFRTLIDERDKRLATIPTPETINAQQMSEQAMTDAITAEFMAPTKAELARANEALNYVNQEITKINEYEKLQPTAETKTAPVEKTTREETGKTSEQTTGATEIVKPENVDNSIDRADNILAKLNDKENPSTLYDLGVEIKPLFTADEAWDKTPAELDERWNDIQEQIGTGLTQPLEAKIKVLKQDKETATKDRKKALDAEIQRIKNEIDGIQETIHGEFTDFSLELRDKIIAEAEAAGIDLGKRDSDGELNEKQVEFADDFTMLLDQPSNTDFADVPLKDIFKEYANEQTKRGGERSQQPDTGSVSDIVSTAFGEPSVASGATSKSGELAPFGFSRDDGGVVGERSATHLAPEERARELAYNGKGGLQGATGRGVLDEYFTPMPIIQKMWGLAKKFGFDGGKVLEPSAGIGRFFEYAPADTELTAIEIDAENAGKIKALYPDVNVINNPFETLFVEDNGKAKEFKAEYDLVIGNPPYGTHRQYFKNLGEEPKIADLETYFIKRGLDLTKDGGLLIYVVPSSFMRSKADYGKTEIAKIGNLIEAYRLPNGLFTGTNVGTDILVFRKQGGVITTEMLSNDTHFKVFENNVLGTLGEIRGRFGLEPGVIGTMDNLNQIDVPEVKQINIQMEEPKPSEKISTRNLPTFDIPQKAADVSNMTIKKLVDDLLNSGGHPNERWEPDYKIDKTGNNIYSASDRQEYIDELQKRGMDNVLKDLGYPTDRNSLWRNIHIGSEETLAQVSTSYGDKEGSNFPYFLENSIPAVGKNTIKENYEKERMLRDQEEKTKIKQEKSAKAKANRENKIRVNAGTKITDTGLEIGNIAPEEAGSKNFQIKLESGDEVGVNYSSDALGIPHFQFYGPATSESGYRSYYGQSDDVISDPQHYAKQLAEEFYLEQQKVNKPKKAKVSTGQTDLFTAPVQPTQVATAETTQAKPKHLDMRAPVSDDEMYSLHTSVDGSLDEQTPQELLDKAPAMMVGGQIKHFSPYNYYQGDIYAKIDQAALDGATKAIKADQMEQQMAGLRRVLPLRIDVRSTQLPPNSKFVAETTVKHEDTDWNIDDLFLKYMKELPSEAFGDSGFYEIRGYLNNERVASGDKELNMKIKNRRREIAQRLFNEFIVKELTDDQRATIDEKYNRLFNGYVHADTSQVPIFSSHSKTFKQRELIVHEHQKTAVGFLVNKGAGLLAHDVGAGKTMSAILAVNETMARGYSKRPLFIVPNGVYAKWISEIRDLLPGVKINELKNLGAKVSIPEIKDNTITIMSYEGLTNLGLKPENFDKITNELSDNLLSAAAKTERAKQTEKQRGEAMAGKAARGTETFIEDLGIDLLTVDEVHNFKNIFTGAKIEKGEGKGSGNEYANVRGASSNRGVKMYYLTQHILNQNNNRNVFALSATPFVNNPLEIYSILSLFGRYKLQQKGVTNVNDFMTNFMNLQNKHVVKAEGIVQLQDVIEEYKNLQPLQDIVREFIDFKGSEDLKLRRPDKQRRIAKIGFTELQAQYTENAQDLFNNKDAGPLVAITEMQNITLSPYNSRYHSGGKPTATEFVENSPKVKYAVDHILEMKKEADKRDEPMGQVIFMPRGVEYFDLIAEYLIKNGDFKKSEIAFIKGGVTPDEKYQIAEAFNSGKVKVVIGSDAMKEGIDLQKNATDMYYLHLPWNPTDIIQAEGRIWRQGNQWANVRIHYPLIENSVDSFLFQKVETKSKRIQNIWSYKGNVMNVADINPEELKLDLITDPVRRVEAEYAFKQFGVENNLRTLKSEKALRAGVIIKLEEYDQEIKDYKELATENPRNKDYYEEHVIEEQQKKGALLRKISEKGLDLEQLKIIAKEFDDKIAIAQEAVNKAAEDLSVALEKAKSEKPARLEIEAKNTDLINGFLKQTRKENPDILTKFEQKARKVAPGSAGAADVFSNLPITEQAWTNVPELVKLSSELMGVLPRVNTRLRTVLGKAVGYSDLQLHPDIFKDPEIVSKVLAHEIGHIVHNLPENIKPSTLLRKLTILDEPKKYLSFKTKQIKEELWTLSSLWRPVTDGSDLEYRRSSAELYADFMSALLNRPDIAAQYAPTFYEQWHNFIERKPDVKEAYISFRKIMNGDAMLLHEQRELDMNAAQEKAIEMDKKLIAEMYARPEWMNLSGAKRKMIRDFAEKNIDAYDKVRNAIAQGEQIKPNERPDLLLEELDYAVNNLFLLFEKLESTDKLRADNKITDLEFSNFMYYHRILGDRAAVANPLGHNPISAQQELDAYLKDWGEEKYQAAENATALFQQTYKEVFKEGYDAGLYDTELFNQLYNDQNVYVSFKVVDHYLDGFVSAKIMHQIGTLKEVANTYQATIAKMMAIKMAALKNEAKTKFVEMLKETAPTEVIEAEVDYRTGHVKEMPDKGIIRWRKEGKLKAAYVDPYVADSYNHDTLIEQAVAIDAIKFFNNKILRKAYIDYSIRFILRNPVRDLSKAYKALQLHDLQGTGKFAISGWELLKEVKKAFPEAWKFAKGELTQNTHGMLGLNIIKIDRTENLTEKDINEATAIERELAKRKLLASKAKLKIWQHIGNFILQVGKTNEALTKISAYRLIKSRLDANGLPMDKETAAYIRNNIGTPNYHRGGRLTPETNTLWMFSNIAIQGWRSTYELGYKSPNSRSGFLLRTAKIALIPKILMFMAWAGLFGAAIAARYRKISHYRLINDITIPLGNSDVDLHIPQDFDDRVAAGLLWLTMESLTKGKLMIPETVTTLSGALPGLTSLISIPMKWNDYFHGSNPIDDFRGGTILTDREYESGISAYSLEPMMKWTWNQVFGGILKVNLRDSIRQEKPIEMALKMPLLNAFLSKTGGGTNEESQAISKEVRAEKAKESLDKQKAVYKYVNAYLDGKGSLEDNINKALIETYGGQEITVGKEDKAIAKQFIEALYVSEGDPVQNSIIWARSTDEQVAIIKNWIKTNKDDAERINTFGNRLIQAHLISANTWNEAVTQ